MTSIMLTIFSIPLLYYSSFVNLEYNFMILTPYQFKMSMILDWHSTSFAATVTSISALIMLYSISYIPPQEHKQFSWILLLFVISMVILIFSNNLMFMLLGWDGLGLTSYALVIYYQNPDSSASGSITILSNRMGDILIIMSISMLTMISNWDFSFNKFYPTLILILLITAAFTKSAQFPFAAWLPAAMAAPTPISALVHSSTLVTAGVYLSTRLMNNFHPHSMLIIMASSSFTALTASMSASWEQDMKKIIALSTLSQIAMMMFAISIGSIHLAFLHMMIHALFKSSMFLCAGIIIHNSSYQDMRHMGSMLHCSPIPSSILGISSMALMGLPFLSGFFSKDAIMEMMMMNSSLSLLTLMMILSIGMTANYTLRMMKLSLKFTMKSKPDTSPTPSNFMESPLLLMAPLTLMGGSMFIWMTLPEQMFILPPYMKLSIMITLMLGALLGMNLKFYSKNFIALGMSAISLWFNHFTSTIPTSLIFPLSTLSLKNDKSWQEMYGPNQLNMFLKTLSVMPHSIMNTLVFTFILLFSLPPLLILFT